MIGEGFLTCKVLLNGSHVNSSFCRPVGWGVRGFEWTLLLSIRFTSCEKDLLLWFTMHDRSLFSITMYMYLVTIFHVCCLQSIAQNFVWDCFAPWERAWLCKEFYNSLFNWHRLIDCITCMNVDTCKTLILGLPQKQNSHPIGYITLLTLISQLKRRLLHLWTFLCGLVPMAKLAESLMGIGDTGKVRNRQVAKSQIILILILVKTFIPQ